MDKLQQIVLNLYIIHKAQTIEQILNVPKMCRFEKNFKEVGDKIHL